MAKKEEIEGNPFLIISAAQVHYLRFDLYLEIELLGKEEVLHLAHGKGASGLGLKKGLRPITKWHYFDENGRKFFNELKPDFGKVWVCIPGNVAKDFSTLEKFLSEITKG
jgi:hypothetical protein